MLRSPQNRSGSTRYHVVLTAYNKDRGRLPLERWVREGKLLMIDTRKSPAFNRNSGHQLPSSSDQLRGSGRKIYTGRDLVKYRNASATGDVRSALAQARAEGRFAVGKGPEDARLKALLAQYANEEGAPSEAEIREAVRQYREVEGRYAEVLRAND